jgi:hypothetical protein
MHEAVLRDLLRQVAGRGHAQREEEPVPDDLPVLGAGDVRDDAAQDPVAQVGVVVGGSRRPGEGRAGRQQLREQVQRKPLLAVPPRIVGRETGRHRHQLANGHRDAVRGRETPGGQLRDVRGDGLVQAEAALVAQQEDRGCGEGLGHGRDAEHGACVWPAVLAVPGRAGAAGMDQLPVPDHAPGDAGDPGLVAEAGEAGVDGPEGFVEGRHPEMMPGLPRWRPAGAAGPRVARPTGSWGRASYWAKDNSPNGP